MAEHSVIGPSALHRLLNCPASHRLSANKPPGKSSGAAAQGTVAHELVENALSDTAVIEIPAVGTVVEEEGHSILVDQDMIDGVDQMLTFCEPLKVGADTFWVESRLDLGKLWDGSPPEPIFGTVDFGALHRDTSTLYVVDFKYGRMPVTPHDNPQALAYSLGACYDLGEFPTHVVNVIIQPRGMDGSPTVKVAQLSGLDLQIWAEETLKPGIDRLFDPAAPLSPGDWCTFCPAKIDCPALYEIAKQKSRAEFGQLPQSPIDFSEDQLGDVLDWLATIEMWVREVRAEASGRIEKGANVSGWKLVPKKAIRKWARANELSDVLPEDRFWDRKVKSPTQVEKVDKRIYDELAEAGFVDRTSSGSTLAPDHDPREAVATKSAKDEFGEL